MPYAARPAAQHSALLALVGWLAACPAPVPSADPARRELPADPRPAEPAPSPAPAPSPSVATPEPAPEPPPTPDASLPPALAAEGVRPVMRSLWQALEAVDAGDAEAMGRAMTEDGRWLPPGSLEEAARGAADMHRAMVPWGSTDVELDVRRILDLDRDGLFAAQVSVAAREGRNELVLLIEPRGDQIAEVRHFGDPLGPVRPRASHAEPLDLGPVGEVALAADPADPALVGVARSLVDAVEGRNDDAVRALLAADVVLHDVAGRRTRRGRDAYVEGMRETLGEAGHVAVDGVHAGAGFVVVEGALLGRETSGAAPAPSSKGPPENAADPAAPPKEHGFADVHRVVDGTIAETWHYVNRRGRPARVAPRP